MDYSIGVDTVATWMAFPITDWNALPLARKNEIIVLGTVAVPAVATNITTAMISFERSTYSWRGLSKGALAWSPLTRNGDFEQAADGTANAWYWALSAAAGTGTGTALVTSTDPDRNSLALTMACTGVGSVTFAATQNVGVPVTPAQLGMIRLRKKNLVVPSSGTIDIDLIFADDTGADLSTVSVNLDEAAVDGAYVEVLSIFEVPAGVTTLSRIVIGGTPTYASTVDVIHIDDVQVWLETEGERNDLQHGVSGDLEVMGRLSMREPGALYSADSLEVNYDSSANQLNIDDQASSGGLKVDINGDLTAGTVTADTAMAADQATIGADIIGTDANASLPRIILPVGIAGGIEYTLMWESVPAGEKGYRKYVSPIGALVETVNATYSNTTNNWTKDVNGETAVRVTLGSVASVGMVVEYQEAGTNTWADGAWTSNVMSVDNTAFNALVAAAGVLTATTITDQINQLRDGVHGAKFMYLGAGLAQESGANDSTNGPSFFPAATAIFGHGWRPDSGGNTEVELPFPLHSGDRILQLKYYLRESSAANDIEVEMHQIDPVAGSDATIGGSKKSGNSNTEAQIIFDFATDGAPWPYTLLTEKIYGATIQFASTASLASFIGLRIQYDHPA